MQQHFICGSFFPFECVSLWWFCYHRNRLITVAMATLVRGLQCVCRTPTIRGHDGCWPWGHVTHAMAGGQTSVSLWRRVSRRTAGEQKYIKWVDSFRNKGVRWCATLQRSVFKMNPGSNKRPINCTIWMYCTTADISADFWWRLSILWNIHILLYCH